MRHITLRKHLSIPNLRRKMVESESKEQFQRWQVLYLMAAKNLNAEEVADLVGLAQGTIYQWIYRYNHQGPESMDLTGRGGRRSAFLDYEEEKALLEEMSEMAEKGVVVIAQTVRVQAEKRIGHRVSKDYPYDLLHRHGWRKIVPRPQHPKSQKEEQEEYKKNFPPSWLPPKKAFEKEIHDP